MSSSLSCGGATYGIGDEKFYATLTFPVVLGRIGSLAIGVYGLLLMGQGKPHGAYFVATVFALFALSALANLAAEPSIEMPQGLATGLAVGGVVMVLFAVGVGLYYTRHTET